MELEYFVKPGEDESALEYWKKERLVVVGTTRY